MTRNEDSRILFRDLVVTDTNWKKLSMTLMLSPRGWRILAEKLCGKTSQELDFIERTEKDPVKAFLSEWSSGKNSHVDDLIQALRAIDNHTVENMIHSMIEEYKIRIEKEKKEQAEREKEVANAGTQPTQPGIVWAYDATNTVTAMSHHMGSIIFSLEIGALVPADVIQQWGFTPFDKARGLFTYLKASTANEKLCTGFKQILKDNNLGHLVK